MTETPAALPVTIADWPRNSREDIRVRLDEYQGNAIFDVRAWYRPLEGDGLKPGKSGIALSVNHLPRMAQAIAVALAEARRLGLLTAPPPEAESTERAQP
jgi:hypothetical protein